MPKEPLEPDIAHRIDAAIESEREPIASLTERLVSCPTENPPGSGYRECLDVLSEELNRLGFPSEVSLVPGESADSEYPRYWLRSQLGDHGRPIYFHGHYDVVPAQHPDTQFVPKTSEKVIHGRGTSDMKGGLVAMIYAMKALAELGRPLPGPVVLNVVPDEETGGARGSAALGEGGLLFHPEARGMLTAEPTSGRVWHASRGAITMEIRVRGRGAHVGLQHLGVNAFESAATLVADLIKLKNQVETRRTGLLVDPEGAAHSIMMMGGVSSSGENFNVVPPLFRFSLDRRFNPEEGLDAEQAAVLDVIDRHRAAGVDVDVDVFQLARSANVSVESPLARSLASSIREVTGKAARFEMCPGILEIRFYAEAGIPAFAYGPGLLSVSHGPEEFVHRADIATAARVYALTAATLKD